MKAWGFRGIRLLAALSLGAMLAGCATPDEPDDPLEPINRVFFDINPGKRRPDRASRFGHFARFSFGPGEEEVATGLERLRALIRAAP